MSPSDIREQLNNQLDTPYNVDLTDIDSATFFIQNVASLLLGVIAYGIAILLTVITALDIAYLAIPIFRERVQHMGWDGSKGKYLRAVSRDAVSAIEEANTVSTGKSSLSIYLLKRIRTYFISVTILALILGGMGYIKGIIVKIVLAIVQGLHG